MVWMLLFLACFVTVFGREVRLPNNQLPLDTDGNPLITGEASVLRFNNSYYFYFNNWGGCPAIDCCDTADGCASCCMTKMGDTCVYTNNHSVVAYRTDDFETWEYLGVALPRDARVDGVEFRPQVIYNKATGKFVMWYEDRHAGQEGYAVAVSPTPQGPFVTVSNSTKMQGKGRSDGSGDFCLFIDDDGSAYHVRDGLVIEKLADNFTVGTGQTASIHNSGIEAPIMFKRNGIYYIVSGNGCCACKGGSNALVYTADSPFGPFTLRGDVGSNPTPFDKHSPNNYVTRAQATAIFLVPSPGGDEQYVYMGNQWQTAQFPGRPRNRDLLYFTKMQFFSNGSVEQFVWQNETTIDLV